MRLGECCDECRCCHEQHRVALPDCRSAERDGNMGLSDARWSEEKKRLAVCNPATCRQLADLPWIERGLGGEVEVGEVADTREVSDLRSHLDPALLLACDLVLEEEAECFA